MRLALSPLNSIDSKMNCSWGVAEALTSGGGRVVTYVDHKCRYALSEAVERCVVRHFAYHVAAANVSSVQTAERDGCVR